MKTIMVKTICGGNIAQTVLGDLRAQPGDYNKAAIQIRRITDIPDDVKTEEVLRLFRGTSDITSLGGKKGKMKFKFSELGMGVIIR